MKKILLGLLIVFVLSSVCFAEIFDIQHITEGIANIQAKDKEKDIPLWKSTVSINKITYQGKPFVYVKEEGQGIYGKDKKWQSWRADAYMQLVGNRVIPYQTKVIYKDKDGNVTQTMTKFFDENIKQAICNVNDEEHGKSFEFKEDLLDRNNLSTALPNYPFDEKRDFVFYLLTHEPTMYKMTMKYLGEETLAVGERQIECYKLEMIPDLGAMNIFGAFVPKTYFWYEKDAPHQFVRYEGLESGLGTPYIAMQITD